MHSKLFSLHHESVAKRGHPNKLKNQRKLAMVTTMYTRIGVVGLTIISLVSAPVVGKAEVVTKNTQSPTVAEINTQASENFDAGRYQVAADLWINALEKLPEHKDVRLQRAAMVENAAIALEEVAKETQDQASITVETELLTHYLDTCTTVYANDCDSFPETARLQQRLQSRLQILQANEASFATRQAEAFGRTLGGRPIAPPRKNSDALPKTSIVAFVFGTAMMGGGAALIFYGAGDQFLRAPSQEQMGASSWRRFTTAAEDDMTMDDSTTGDDTGTPTSSGSTIPGSGIKLSPKTKGRLLIGAGSLVAAMGVGLIVLGSLQVAKYRRLRTKYVQVAPQFGKAQAGLVISGQF